MWDSDSRTISPSVRTTTRNTPWVLGCCGPMLRSISSVFMSAISVNDVLDPVIALGNHVVLPQSMPLPVLGAQDPRQVVVTLEDHAHQVEGLALVPVGRVPDVLHRGDPGRLAVEVRLGDQTVVVP